MRSAQFWRARSLRLLGCSASCVIPATILALLLINTGNDGLDFVHGNLRLTTTKGGDLAFVQEVNAVPLLNGAKHHAELRIGENAREGCKCWRDGVVATKTVTQSTGEQCVSR